jgi:hypothetical protein
MKWWFIQWILMTMWWWSLWFWGNLFWDDGYTLLRASTVPTTVGPLVPRDVSMTIRFIWNWLMIRTSGGTLMKGTWNWGCLFDLVCLPAKLRFDIYIYIQTLHIYTYMRDYIWYIWGIWMYLSFVTVCVMSSMHSPGSREPRCWPEACPTANRWSSNCAATSTWHDGGIFSRSWRMMIIEKTWKNHCC